MSDRILCPSCKKIIDVSSNQLDCIFVCPFCRELTNLTHDMIIDEADTLSGSASMWDKEDSESLDQPKAIQPKRNLRDNVILRLMLNPAIFIFLLCIFWISAMMFLRGVMIFHQEFYSHGEGKIISNQYVIKRGQRLQFSNGSEFFLILRETPKIGDVFKKEKNSFRYLVNGQNIATRTELMNLISFGTGLIGFPSVVLPIIIFIFLIFLNSFMYIRYRLSPFEGMMELGDYNTSGKFPSQSNFYVSPYNRLLLWLFPIILLTIYLITYMLLPGWL